MDKALIEFEAKMLVETFSGLTPQDERSRLLALGILHLVNRSQNKQPALSEHERVMLTNALFRRPLYMGIPVGELPKLYRRLTDEKKISAGALTQLGRQTLLNDSNLALTPA